MNKRIFNTAIASAIVLTAGVTVSHSASAQSEDQIRDLLACEKIKNSEDKLECYDAVIAILKQQETSREQNRSSAEGGQRRRSVDTRTTDFGLSQQQIDERDGQQGRKKAPKQQIFEFTHKWRDAAGKYYFLTTNGQIWKEVKGSHLIVPKRAKKIRIKRNLMGGYMAFIEGMNGRQGRVKRIR